MPRAENKDSDAGQTCMQPVNGKRCGKPAKYALAIEFHFFHEEVEKYDGIGWFTCGEHKYDMTVTFQLRELDT